LWLLSGCGDLLEAGPVAGDGPGGVLGEVVPQVPAVSDLDRVGGAVAGAFGVGAGPVPADHPRARVRGEPVFQRASLAAGQDVDGPAGAGVDQDGAVDVPFAQREVIDAQCLRRGTEFGVWQVDDQPQQRAAVHRDTQRPGQPRPGPSRQLQRDLGQ
jgi:hypothetical protein